jgi:hypothetical protein
MPINLPAAVLLTISVENFSCIVKGIYISTVEVAFWNAVGHAEVETRAF